ncbi:hypothetical protein ACLQ3F_21065 [Micromonospora sp. DT15]|uniref:hypothetical protein n=1 Tax=Micromonospora sp. DT15 TaxID=3393445 RepID=UPI003CE6BAE5
MAKKMLGKVVAGAALGGASLLVFAPGIAFADGHDDGKVYAKPHVVKAGDEVKLLEICPDRQEHAYVWSKVTGKVKLKPADEDRGEDREWREEEDSSDHDKGKDEHGKDENGKDDKGKDHEGKDDSGKDEHGKDDKGKDDKGKDENGKGGQGGGAAADAYGDEGSKDWKGEEHGQDAEEGRDKKDWDSKDEDKKDWESKDEHGSEYGSDKGWENKDEHGSEYGSDKGWENKDEHGSEYGSDKGWENKDEHGSEYGSDERGGYGKDERGSDERGGYGKDERGSDERDWDKEREFVYYGEAKVDKDAKPGRYELKGSCGEGELVVLPHGGVDGGDGGASTGTDRGLATGGAGVLGAAALGGIVLMRRRRTDGSLV